MNYNWHDLNQMLPDCDEATVKQLLDEEIAKNRRAVFIKRLHQRYNALRVARERKELLAAVRK